MELKKQFSGCAWTCVVLVAVSCSVQTQDASEETFVCVPYYQCSKYRTVNIYGEDLIIIKQGIVNRRGRQDVCNDILEVRCKIPDEFKSLATNTTATEAPPAESITEQLPVPTTTEPSFTPSVVKPALGCGVRRELSTPFTNTNGGIVPCYVQHLVSAGATHYAEFPWTMMLLIKEHATEDFKVKCGGSLVHPRVVVTAAHCVEVVDQSTITVRGGEWDFKSQNEPLPHQDRSIQLLVIHPDYKPGILHNDIAVLIVDSPFNITENVDIICTTPANFAFDGARCVASGWGQDSINTNSTSQDVLRKVDLKVVLREPCQADLRKSVLGRFFLLHESFICAKGENGRDTCQGDGGGPLVCPSPLDPKRWVQVGIVSWGIECGSKYPAVYTNIFPFINWVVSQIPLPTGPVSHSNLFR